MYIEAVVSSFAPDADPLSMEGLNMYRRQHEKALAKIVDKICEQILNDEKGLAAELEKWKVSPETIEKLARIQDLSSRRYQMAIIRREVKKILIESKNLLVATIVNRLDN